MHSKPSRAQIVACERGKEVVVMRDRVLNDRGETSTITPTHAREAVSELVNQVTRRPEKEQEEASNSEAETVCKQDPRVSPVTSIMQHRGKW